MVSSNATLTIQGNDREFLEILSGNIGSKVAVVTNFLGTNTPEFPTSGQLEYVCEDSILIYERVGIWVLIYRSDIAYVVLEPVQNPPIRQKSNVSNVYATDILFLNIGKKVNVFLNFMVNGPRFKVFESVLMFVGINVLIIHVPVLRGGGSLAFSWINLAYVVFRERPVLPNPNMENPPHQYLNVNALDILLENRGNYATIWTNFVGSSVPEIRTLNGKILFPGTNALVIDESSEIMRGPTLVHFSNIAYVLYHDPLRIPKKAEQVPGFIPLPKITN